MGSYMRHEPQTEPRREGRLGRTIERQTAKLPADLFLWAAIGSIGGSLALRVAGKSHAANWIGEWAPTFLILGLYNKMMRLQGSEAR